MFFFPNDKEGALTGSIVNILIAINYSMLQPYSILKYSISSKINDEARIIDHEDECSTTVCKQAISINMFFLLIKCL